MQLRIENSDTGRKRARWRRRLGFDQRGFTLVEAVIATSILAIGIMGTVGLQSEFAKHTTQREVLNCAVDIATSALNLRRVGETPPTSESCDNDIDATVALTETTVNNECDEVTVSVTATARGGAFNQQFTLTGLVCNFN